VETISQFLVTSLATALCWYLLRRLPQVTALRWWTYASACGFAALLLTVAAAASSRAVLEGLALTAALLCGGAQIFFVTRGLSCTRQSDPRWMRYSLVASFVVLLGFGVVALAGGAGVAALAVSEKLVIPVVCALFGVSFWLPSGRRSVISSVGSAALLGISICGLLGAVVSFQIIPQLLAHVVAWQSWTVIGQFAAGLSIACLIVMEIENNNVELRTRAERLASLVDSTPVGICELDTNGSIRFVNQSAAAMLAKDERDLAGAPIHDLFELQQDETLPSPSDFILRPTTAVSGARARLRRGYGDFVSVEWSSSPIQEDGNISGALLTLRDVTQREAVDRFHKLRSEILELIARNKPVEQTAKLLTESMEERLPGFYCSVLLCEGESFRVVASPRVPYEFRSALNEVPATRVVTGEHDKGPMGYRNWDRAFSQLGPKHGFRGTWTEAMMSSANEVLGVIVLNHSEAANFGRDEKSILEQAARLGALAVEHRRTFERLTHQGQYDSLTGLPNRLLLEDRLKQALARAERTFNRLAVLAIDLDRFKYVNDTFGHDTGDLFLQQISVRLASRIRATDTLARTGGDEFTALLVDVKDLHEAEKVAESLTASLAEPFEIDGHTLYGAVSIGISIYPKDGMDAEPLRRNADRALYRAKSKGSNCVQSYSLDDANEDSNRLEIEVQLHHAIKKGNFELHYQPQFTCDKRLIGFEALLRFNHPKLGMVPPSHFIPIAEESGLILPIGEWVLREACRQVKEWEAKGLHPVRVAVNGSPLQFAQANFYETVATVLEKSNMRPEFLELEVTEGTLMQSLRDSANQMQTLTALGVSISVDDFGTGYSSLSYLHQLPIHILKIDRSFIANMMEPGGTRSIVEAIISLAHSLGLKTVAEGVEKNNQLEALRAAGCDFIQGFVFSRPLSAINASRLLFQNAVANTATPGPDLFQPASPGIWMPSRSFSGAVS
jgi:diguanylate cyclase (GGDEF)-like protein/PAS domain S-box-containing protein